MDFKLFSSCYKQLLFLGIFTLAMTGAHGAKLIIPEETRRDLTEQRALLDEIMRKLDETNRKIATTRSDINSAIDSIELREKESRKAKSNLERKQAYDRDNPGEIVEQLRAAEEKNIETSRALADAKEKRIKYETELIAQNRLASRQYNEFLKQQKSFEREVDRIVDVELQARLRSLQVSKVVEATERVPCGNDPIPVCKERSKKAAELKASEQGSIVLINSLTEVKNFKLTKEELRSEVRATLSNKTFSNQHLIGETEYETTVKANVEPVIGEALREQIADNIRSDIYAIVGGRVDYSQVINPDAVGVGGTSSSRKVKRANTESRPAEVPDSSQEEARQEETPRDDEPVRRTPRRLEKPIFTF